MERKGGGSRDHSETAFNMITAGTDRHEGKRGGEAVEGLKERGWRGYANTDKYFIPQHTESLRLVPRGGGQMQGGGGEREKAEREGKAKKRQKADIGRRVRQKKEREKKGREEREMGQLRD